MLAKDDLEDADIGLSGTMKDGWMQDNRFNDCRSTSIEERH